tara:strand:- start:101 stop:667 length:567 start_codon:yes stop_codon:yes gene_type:complete
MKVNANSLKIGNLIFHNNELWTVVKLNHVKPGKGGAFIQTELKNAKDNRKLNDRFRSSENIDRIILDERKCSFLFQENNSFVFMDLETFEQLEVESNLIGNQKAFLSDGMEVLVNTYENQIISIDLPETCEVEIIEADAVIKGQTVSSSFKPALTKNGVKVMVPGHIEVGSKIIIKPADGSYVEKSKS